jgi:hypothetical protein
MLIYHNNFTQTFFFAQKMIFCKIKFFILCIVAWNCLSKSRKIVFLLKKFDEMTFSSDLMRWRFRQIWWDDVFSSSLMSRFRQIWWVVLVKFDKSFICLSGNGYKKKIWLPRRSSTLRDFCLIVRVTLSLTSSLIFICNSYIRRRVHWSAIFSLQELSLTFSDVRHSYNRCRIH